MIKLNMDLTPDSEFILTLEDFQNGEFEISDNEFIYYINNRSFYSRWQNKFNKIICDYRSKSYIAGIKKIISKIISTKPVSNRKDLFFLGFEHRSMDSVELIKKFLSFINQLSETEIIVVLGKGDYEITDEIAKFIPENVKYLFANNVNTQNPRARYLPLGRDFRSADFFSSVKPKNSKNHLCYCNFSLSTHKIRESIYNSIKNMDFIEFEHMGKFLTYDINSFEFYTQVSESKFIICPRGNGIDTFRLWDSLYLGAIPIVVKEAEFHKNLFDLPILFLDSYEDYSKLNKEFLEEQYNIMLKKHYNYQKLMFSFWINEIENC